MITTNDIQIGSLFIFNGRVFRVDQHDIELCMYDVGPFNAKYKPILITDGTLKDLGFIYNKTLDGYELDAIYSDVFINLVTKQITIDSENFGTIQGNLPEHIHELQRLIHVHTGQWLR
jgi:hypothetical protein